MCADKYLNSKYGFNQDEFVTTQGVVTNVIVVYLCTL
jgi:hypothetical protein